MSKRAVVLGMGVSGKAAARLLKREGYDVIGIDQHVESAEGVVMVKSAADIVDSFDLVVVSPGISPYHSDYQCLLSSGVELIGEAEWGCRFLTSEAVAITGTNGKTTVTSLVAHVLNQVGFCAETIGNIGLPICDYVLQEQRGKIAVVELSSYQLDTLRSKVFSGGVLLNITPDHLDRYPSFEAYAKSKWHLKDCLKDEGLFIVEEQTYRCWASRLGETEAVLFGGEDHLKSNFLAAEKLCCHLGVEKEDFRRAASTFKHLPHRIESVATVNGVEWIDDSKGTNVDAVIQAVRIFRGRPIVLIAGGVDKGSSYVPWIEEFKDNVVHVCAIGQAAPIIADAISSTISVSIYATMQEAVDAAEEFSSPGGVVLLSPGCSSFDMFRDYHHRGEVFKEIVGKLQTQVGFKERCQG